MSIAPRNPYIKVGKQRFTYEPCGLDIWDRRANQPVPGTVVVKVQPSGCPKNGTMRHCYIAPVDNLNSFALVLEASLKPTK